MPTFQVCKDNHIYHMGWFGPRQLQVINFTYNQILNIRPDVIYRCTKVIHYNGLAHRLMMVWCKERVSMPADWRKYWDKWSEVSNVMAKNKWFAMFSSQVADKQKIDKLQPIRPECSTHANIFKSLARKATSSCKSDLNYSSMRTCIGNMINFSEY